MRRLACFALSFIVILGCGDAPVDPGTSGNPFGIVVPDTFYQARFVVWLPDSVGYAVTFDSGTAAEGTSVGASSGYHNAEKTTRLMSVDLANGRHTYRIREVASDGLGREITGAFVIHVGDVLFQVASMPVSSLTVLPVAMAANGNIVGWDQVDGRALAWRALGELVIGLPVPFGYVTARPTTINSKGDVAGSVDGRKRVVVWKLGVPAIVDDPARGYQVGRSPSALTLTDDGALAIQYFSSVVGPGVLGGILRPNGEWTDLPFLPLAMNASEVAVGATTSILGWPYFYAASTTGGFPIPGDIVMRTTSQLTAINSVGCAIGEGAGLEFKVFRSCKGGKVTDLTPMVGQRRAIRINTRGEILTADGLLIRDDRVYRITLSDGWALAYAVDLNDAGQVLGLAYVNGAFQHPVRLTPK